MYSKAIQDLFKKKRIKIGDRLSIKKGGQTFGGLLLPKSDIEDPKAIVIKADSGYNLGITYGAGVSVSKSGKKTSKSVRDSEKFELGKIKKSLTKLSFDKSKDPISMIATGGTIASRVDYRTGGVYMLMKPKEFLHNVPELADIANFKSIENPFNKASEDMDSKEWAEIAKSAAKRLNAGDKGVIVTHGTDTLHFTAAALSFMLPGLRKPVALVGAQKSSDRASADTAINLICASHIARSEIGEVGICMHGSMDDDYCIFNRGTKVRKMHTSRRDTFRPINEKPLAQVWPDGKLKIINKAYTPREDCKIKADTKFEPKVAMLKAYPGSEPKIIDAMRDMGYKGFVIEGTGLGHVPSVASRKSWIPTIKRAIKDGVPVVIAPQTLYGRLNTHVYSNLIDLFYEAKAISAQDMLPETAYVKLGWVLGHTKDIDEVRKLMATNIAGELSTCTDPKAFLY